MSRLVRLLPTISISLTLAVIIGGYFLFHTPSTVHAANTAFYVDCSQGGDGTGTLASPWNTLDDVNNYSGGFGPGNSIYFRRGTTCTGNLHPSGSGTSTAVITLDAYSTDGATAKPVLAGNGTAEAAIYLHNQDYWTVENLEVTNDASTVAQRSGVLLEADDNAFHHGITIQDLDVHNVYSSIDFHDYKKFHSGGIHVRRKYDNYNDTNTGGFDNLTIQDNYVHDLHATGITFSGTNLGGASDLGTANWGTNVVVRNNLLSKVGADAIIVESSIDPLIEGNISYDAGYGHTQNELTYIVPIWAAWVKDALFQFNEAARTVQTGDSYAWDCEAGSCTFQYNYSHDNAGGILLNCISCQPYGAPSDAKITFRYNIAQNDCRTGNTGPAGSLLFYNNVVYCPNKAFAITLADSDPVSNNIFVGQSGASLPSNASYSHNLYYGFTGPTDANAVTSDPRFVAPGSASDGIATTNGYILQSGSPAIGQGTTISSNGGRDFFGNNIPSASPNMGAYEGAGVSSIDDIVTGSGTNQFAYTSSWQSCTGCNATGIYENTAHYTSSTNTGEGYMVAFTGTQIVVRGGYNSDHGIIAFAVCDGQGNNCTRETDVDTYRSGGYLADQVLYASPPLGNGAHLLKAHATGQANSSSQGHFLDVDRAIVIIPTGEVNINTGGSYNGAYSADTDGNGGNTASTSTTIATDGITNPAPQAVYQTERYGNATYTIPNLTAGSTYRVRLHFAEIYWNNPGQRIFSVSINGTTMLSNFDIIMAAGGKNIGVVKTFSATANTNGTITIQFSTVTDNAKIAGIQVTNH